jgi:hypothetical protein
VSEKDEMGLTEEWMYSVTTENTGSKGTFKGYVMIGSESAIVLQLSDGIMRYIPITKIVHIDLIGPGERKRTDEKRPGPAYYG